MPNKEQNINKNNEEKVSIQSQDQRGFFYRLFNKYKFTKKKRTDLETSAALDKDLSKDDQASTEEIPSYEEISTYLKSFLEEKNLLQQRNIEINSNNRTFFINYLNEKHRLNSNMPLSEETKAALIAITNTYELSVEKTTPQEKLKAIANELINRNLSTLQEHEIIYLLEIETKDRDTLRTIYKELKKIQESQKDANVKAVTIAFTNIYKLSEDQPNSQNNLKAIAKTIVDLDLSDEQKREVILELEIPKKDKDTLRSIYKELKIIQESQKDANIKAVTLAITNIYKLSEDQPNSQNNLKAIAKTIVDLDLSDEQKREVILELEIPKKDKDTLRKMYSNKLEKKLQKLHWERVSIATAISSKYLLSIEKTTPQEKLKAIANELMHLNPSEVQGIGKDIFHLLEMKTRDRKTLRTIYNELKKTQESQKDANIKAATLH
ncbi:hypothetical protein PSG77_04415 [Enterococcus hirae]|uniref:hypothetical protein n=1 Tax=Enterococcus hirae TaxID=1354 RepID=UPI0029541907|nr:hypothetical protein [Enterococcus hirae]MDV7771440.1 hypothetical protein [Enterococcus hirae]